jgi:hypothetical protein
LLAKQLLWLDIAITILLLLQQHLLTIGVKASLSVGHEMKTVKSLAFFSFCDLCCFFISMLGIKKIGSLIQNNVHLKRICFFG